MQDFSEPRKPVRSRLSVREQYKAPPAPESEANPVNTGWVNRDLTLNENPIGDWMDTVVVGDCRYLLRDLPEHSVDLVIADPPYWKVAKERWDFHWKLESDYIAWSKEWISEVSRVIKRTGAFYIFGYFRILAYLLPHIEEMGFKFRQQIVVHKGKRALGGRATRGYKMFPNVTESILFFQFDNRPCVQSFLKERQTALGLTAKQINHRLGVESHGGGVWSLYTGDNILGTIPTANMWERLQEVLDFDIPYSKIQHTFNIEMGITDVWSDIDFYSEKRYHTTQKPTELIARLVRGSTNPGMVVLDPFMGSGTTAVVAKREGRHYVGIEINPDYVEICHRRLADIAIGVSQNQLL